MACCRHWEIGKAYHEERAVDYNVGETLLPPECASHVTNILSLNHEANNLGTKPTLQNHRGSILYDTTGPL